MSEPSWLRLPGLSWEFWFGLLEIIATWESGASRLRGAPRLFRAPLWVAHGIWGPRERHDHQEDGEDEGRGTSTTAPTTSHWILAIVYFCRCFLPAFSLCVHVVPSLFCVSLGVSACFFFRFFLPSFFLSFVFFPFLLSFFLSFYLSLSLSVSVCGAKEVDKGRVPGLGRKVVFAASTPTALSAVGATGKVDVLAEGTRSDVAVDGFPVQLVSISKSFAALCISAATLLNVPSKD